MAELIKVDYSLVIMLQDFVLEWHMDLKEFG